MTPVFSKERLQQSQLDLTTIGKITDPYHALWTLYSRELGQSYERVITFFDNQTILEHAEGDWVIQQYKNNVCSLMDIKKYRRAIKDPAYTTNNLYLNYLKSMIRTQIQLNKIMEPYGVKFYIREGDHTPIIRITDHPVYPNGIYVVQAERFNPKECQNVNLVTDNIEEGEVGIYVNDRYWHTVHLYTNPIKYMDTYSAWEIDLKEQLLRPNFDQLKKSFQSPRMPKRLVPPKGIPRHSFL
jgi:hypothetical protein